MYSIMTLIMTVTAIIIYCLPFIIHACTDCSSVDCLSLCVMQLCVGIGAKNQYGRCSVKLNKTTNINMSFKFLCPQLQRSWRGILLLGCSSVHPSVRHTF